VHFDVLSRKSIALTVALTAQVALAGSPLIKIAIIDTGLDMEDPRFKSVLCESGHRNFVRGEGIRDLEGHGTHIAGLVKRYAGDSEGYCFMILKYYSAQQTGSENSWSETLAMQWAIASGADFVNISGGGPDRLDDECKAIQGAPSTQFVFAAGNDNLNLSEVGNNFYPASCGGLNVSVVGARKNADGKASPLRTRFSNHGTKVTDWEVGEDVLSALPGGRVGTLSGTSQATAIHTGKLVRMRITGR
jgi:membrane-anchored mycosin MYCP